MIVLGADVGLNRAVAMLDEDGELIAIEDMPCLDDGPAGRRAIDAPLLAKIIDTPTWKRAAGIPCGTENKDLVRTRAIARWPLGAQLFRRKCDVDRAEAALIAVVGLERESRQ
jgi:hypothetical protein